MNSGRSKAMTPALSVTKRTWWVVRSSTSGTGQPEPASTTSMRQGSPAAAAASVQTASAPIMPVSLPGPEHKTPAGSVQGGLRSGARDAGRRGWRLVVEAVRPAQGGEEAGPGEDDHDRPEAADDDGARGSPIERREARFELAQL